jgi:tetratricopeptide (TPR) repeat protein
MICDKCGKEIPKDSKFCPLCGTQVTGTMETRQKTQSPAVKHKKQGDEFYEQWDDDPDDDDYTLLEKAIDEYSRAIGADNAYADAYTGRGRAYYMKDWYDEAINDYSAAIHLDSKEPEHYFGRGEAYYDKGWWNEAIDDFTIAIRLEPNETRYYFNRGLSYKSRGDTELAAQDFEETVKRDPSDFDVLLGLGNIYLTQNPSKAVYHLKRAIGVNPNSDEAYYLRGLSYRKIAESDEDRAEQLYRKALSDLNKAIQLDKDVSRYYNQRGIVHDALEEYDLAIDDYETAIQLEPDDAVLYWNRGFSYAYNKDYDEAIDDLQQAISLYDDDIDHESIEKCQKAINDIKKAKEDNSGGCFITTAVCESLSRSDDCYELTAFRKFRDTWLAVQPGEKALIEEYYRIAPGIVRAINAASESKAVYRDIWNRYLSDCLHYIEAGAFEDCRQKYTEMVEALSREWSQEEEIT